MKLTPTSTTNDAPIARKVRAADKTEAGVPPGIRVRDEAQVFPPEAQVTPVRDVAERPAAQVTPLRDAIIAALK